MNWTYDQSDPALMLFTAAVARFGMTFPPGSRILELGCAETDWLERMARLDPTYQLVGVDARRQERCGGPTIQILEASAMQADLFAPETFDRIVMLGALEHFGLGYYTDPVDDNGDTKTMQNCGRWLKPGGSIYFDVPANPTYRVTENRHFRIYNQAEIYRRLLYPMVDATEGGWEARIAYSDCEPHAGDWCAEPTTEKIPYHFAAVYAERS